MTTGQIQSVSNGKAAVKFGTGQRLTEYRLPLGADDAREGDIAGMEQIDGKWMIIAVYRKEESTFAEQQKDTVRLQSVRIER